jgi:hypothetical protein
MAHRRLLTPHPPAARKDRPKESEADTHDANGGLVDTDLRPGPRGLQYPPDE